MTPPYKVLNDSKIRHLWRSQSEPDDEALIEPSWYEENGTPVANDGDDMTYIETRYYPDGEP